MAPKPTGSKTNWKNNTEDIWFATVSDDYVFNVDAVKLKRRGQGLAGHRQREVPHHTSIEHLDRSHSAVLVHAGEHGCKASVQPRRGEPSLFDTFEMAK